MFLEHQGGGVVTAVLMSPPLTSGVRTTRMLSVATRLLGFDDFMKVNLFGFPTRDLPDLTSRGSDVDGWLAARPAILSGVSGATGLLAAWGVVEPGGLARQHCRSQLVWLSEVAARSGHTRVWTLGGQPRHPSRWHQYVSDRHQRTGPGTTAQRLEEMLVLAPIKGLCSD